MPAPEQWASVRQSYVAQQLPGGLIDALHDQGLLYADSAGNAVFLQRDLETRDVTGAVRLGGDGLRETVVGSDRTKGRFYWLRGGAAEDRVQQVVVGQTPVDALALGLRSPLPEVRTMYLSADGMLPIGYLQRFSPRQMMVAMNRDELGQRLAKAAQEALPGVRQVQPEGEDWLESLQVGWARSVQRQMQDLNPAQLER
jgi:hypothetical protein